MSALYLRQGRKPLLCVLVVLVTTVIVSCASVPQPSGQPVKSPNDDYQYRLLTLDNELEVLLISDPDTPKAAAALDVMVGSGDNPAGRGGLAHFLEHMLFLGTDKYPDAAEYEQYITEHGGSRNAYTSLEHTNYFFDVNAPFLPEALDRFAQFFIAPRFDTQYVDREKNAVEAEYQMGLKSDPRRGLDVLQEVMNPQHPYSQFSVGSLDTLADRPGSSVRDELISFYEKHYSANAMRLVVLGAESLDELQALVTPVFNLIPNKSFQHNVIEAPLFEPGALPMFVQVQPLATLRQLQVSFPIDDYRDLYSEKPVSYLGNLVGHEGQGSLLSQLKEEGLAESLSAGAGLGWRGGALFSVSIALTEKGAADYGRVLQLLYAYLDMLRDEGPREWLYTEQSSLADLSFRFREQGSPINYVRALAGGMHTYSAEDILRGPYMMDRYDEDVLLQLLGRIVPDNALVILDDKNVATNQVSRRYQVPYASQSVTAQQRLAWRGTATTDALHLPAPNKFIAQDTSLVSIDSKNPSVPEVALRSGRQTIWFLQDDDFRLPKGATYINFRSPEVGQNVQQTAAAVLYTALLMDELNEFAYPARLAGLGFSFYKHAQGISLRMSGYNDKQIVLLRQLLAAIASPAFDQRRFDNIRKDMIRSLGNTAAKRPSSQVMDDLREALLYGEWGEQAMIAALEHLSLDGLRDYARLFWSTATAEALIYGNYEPGSVVQLSDLIAGIISAGPAPVIPDLRILKLNSGESLQYAVDVAHDDSVVAWYLQGEGDSWPDKAATALTAQIMKSGFFQQLRTEQQLGYVAATFAWPQMDVPGLVMLIQSPVADANTVARAMRVFMQGVEPALDEAQFERHQAALVSDILRPDKNLWERAEFYWQSIARKQLDFAGKKDLAEAVEALTLQSWVSYYNRVFLQQSHSLQVVAPGRWDRLPEGDYSAYDSAEAIKSGHDAYIVK